MRFMNVRFSILRLLFSIYITKVIVFSVMSKKFIIDGREFCGNETNFHYLQGVLKENVQVDDLKEWKG